jgi:pectinesterase
MRILRSAVLAATLTAGTLDAQGADSASPLSPSRIGALPAAERQAWERYVDTSRRQKPVADGSIAARVKQVQALLGADGRGPRERQFGEDLETLLAAQFPNGCWPAAYPLRGDPSDAATFDAAVMPGILRLLGRVARGEAPSAGADLRRRAGEGEARGIDCILHGQVVVDGRRTVWSVQHDPLTLASRDSVLSAADGAALLEYLVELDPSDPRVSAAVREGAGWVRETMLWGIARRPGEPPVATPGAGPLWAGFYEMGSNRGLYPAGPETRYDWRAVPDRMWHADWLTDAPAAVLRRYDAWSAARASAASAPVPGRPDVMVDARHAGADGQVVSGMPIYRSIGAALAAAPADGREAFVIAVRPGRYREKLSIDKPNIHLVGEGRDGTVLTYDVAAGHTSPGGWPYGTRGSWTLRIAAPGFRLERMTVENAFDFMGNEAKPEGERIMGTQAVAVMLDSGSDRAVFRDCRLSGHQDTLFPNAGRSYFGRCEIAGSVDFIFGAGRAVFDDCDIVSRDRGSASNNGYITAPSTPVSQPYGFLFVGGRLRRETPGMAPNSVTLGRPWHPSGRPDAIGSAVFINVWMDDHVGATGWSPMNSTDAAGNRVENQPEDARFFEFGSTGPGAVASPSRRVLTAAQAAEFTIARVLDGWDPRS